ncbi:uncharacterized protein [Choristoneura fumiferana]|uniref:uncharacterized protein n=1 Tax=Choristoneura fumiferana TaxID=7141 RepID=UPI003D15B806
MDTQKKLIVEGNSELDAVISKFRLAEIGRKHAEEVQGTSSKPIEVGKVLKGKSPRLIRCGWCGQQHEQNLQLCLARGKECTKCKKMNHFASVCRSKFVKTICQNEEHNTNSDEEFYCGSINKMILINKEL